MNSEPLVSVIIPFYKNAHWLDEALETVAEQSYQKLEVIIINDGSTEDLSFLKQKFFDFQFFETANAGAGAARNLGIDLAKGEYICFLDSDDIWYPDKVKKQLSYMISHKYSWSHTNYETFRDNTPDKIQFMNTTLQGWIIPRMFITCPIATPCVMIRAEVLRRNKSLRFKDSYEVGEDSILWFRLAQLYELGHMTDTLTKVRLRGKNAAYNPKLQLQSKAQFYKLIKGNSVFFRYSHHYVIVLFGFFIANRLEGFLNRNFSGKKPSIFRKLLYSLAYVIPYIYLKASQKILNI